MSKRGKKNALAVAAQAKLTRPKKTRWEKAADRQNARLTRDNPLFVHAGIVALTTAPAQQARVEKIVDDFSARIAASEAANVIQAAALRDKVAARVSPAELDRLDAHRLIFPKTAVYAVCHWQDELAKLDAPPALPVERVLGATCAECGWTKGSGTYHPGDCPALRSRNWKLGSCADCKASSFGGCAAHIAEVKAIDTGEVPMPTEFPRRSAVAAT